VGLFYGAPGRLAAFLLVTLSLFWMRTPLESWVGTALIRARTAGEFQLVRKTVLLLALASAAGLLWLFWGWQNLALIWIGCAAGIAFLLQSLVKRIWRGSRTAPQIIGAAGLTSTAAAAYYVVTGRLDTIAWSLWAANLLFAINQIQFVQLRIHAARASDRAHKVALGRGFLASQILLATVLFAACAAGIFRWSSAIAFLPVLVRGFAWFAVSPKPLAIHALGKSELFHACLFGVLLVVSIRFP